MNEDGVSYESKGLVLGDFAVGSLEIMLHLVFMLIMYLTVSSILFLAY